MLAASLKRGFLDAQLEQKLALRGGQYWSFDSHRGHRLIDKYQCRSRRYSGVLSVQPSPSTPFLASSLISTSKMPSFSVSPLVLLLSASGHAAYIAKREINVGANVPNGWTYPMDLAVNWLEPATRILS